MAVKNVQAMQRFQNGSSFYVGGIAAEPGLDYKSMDVNGFNGPAEVTVVDYSSQKQTLSKKMKTLREFTEFFERNRPKWAKVRWINVNGLNWQCIKLLATKYNLHRLAIEDLLSVQRTKLDLYQDHTYVCLLLHVLMDDDDQIVVDDENSDSVPRWTEEQTADPSLWRKVSAYFKRRSDTGDIMAGAEAAVGAEEPRKLNTVPIAQHYHPDRRLIHDQVKSTRESSFTVAVEQVSIFLTSDGTVITFFQQSGRAIEKPIIERIASENTILRTSEDPSLLLQSIIDAVVDLSFPIATAYQELIADLEIDVLTNPQMRHTRELHIVSGELNILKRTLYPLYHVINALREHRSIKNNGCSDAASASGSWHDSPKHHFMLSEYNEKTRGAEISTTARIYLADVADHVLILTEEIDILKGTVENMINMIFNLVAATQNESMRQLTMASLIFLPLTFLTGYFGMNFNQEHWRVLTYNGPTYFWKIAIPATILVLCVLMYSYIRRSMKTLGRQVIRKKVKVTLRKNRELRRHRGTGGILKANTARSGAP